MSDDGGLVKQSYLGVDFVTPTYFPPHSSTSIRSAYWTNVSLIESQSGSENPESVSTSHDSYVTAVSINSSRKILLLLTEAFTAFTVAGGKSNFGQAISR